MKQAVLFCYSYHHNNTRKVAEALSSALPVRVVHIPVREEVDLGDYDIVGFASGVYFSEFGKPLSKLIDSLEGLNGKSCFTLCTHGAPIGSFGREIQEKLRQKGANVLGGWDCRGFDTYGPFKLVGGLAKGRPNEKDMASAVAYVKSLMEQ